MRSTDVAGNITYLNPVAESMTGWSRQDASGRPLPEVLRLVDGDSREPALNPLAMAILHNKTVGLSAHCVLEFDHGQRISRLVYEVEEDRQERTQEVRVEVSSDHGRTYRQVLAQGYTFSPHGATFQHEDLRLDLSAITHLSLTIVPNKGGSGVATLTSLRLFA